MIHGVYKVIACLRLVIALNLNSYQMHQLNVCWYNAYRRIFYYNSWESVKDLQYYCGRLVLTI